MKLTDVPESSLYLQKNAIVQLVVDIVDINTGEPVPLQTATNMQIGVLYPDFSSAIFTATLYTDGSDGKIVYTTQQGDLSESGLYKIQGTATIGGIQQPWSRESDFYVMPNASDQSAPTPSLPILIDSNGGYWQLKVLPTGNLDTEPVQNPQDAVPYIYLQDSTGHVWKMLVEPSGNLVTE